MQFVVSRHFLRFACKKENLPFVAVTEQMYRQQDFSKLRSLGETMLLSGGKHTETFRTPLATTQSETYFSQSEIQFERFEVVFCELRLVAGNGFKMQCRRFSYANVTVGFVRVVVGNVDVGKVAYQPKACR